MSEWEIIQGDAVVSRYVRALYEVSVSCDKREEIATQIKKVQTFCSNLENADKIFKRFSLIPGEGVAFVESLSEHLKLSSEVKNFLRVVLHNRRFSVLQAICSAYLDYFEKTKGKKIFYVTYAHDFSPHDKEQLIERLKKIFEGDIECVAKKDESLIDGLQIRYRSKILDYSLKSKLRRLEHALKGDSYEN